MSNENYSKHNTLAIMIELHIGFYGYITEKYPELLKGVTFEISYGSVYCKMLSGDMELINKVIGLIAEYEENKEKNNMYFGTESLNNVNDPVVLEIEVDHDFYEYIKENHNDILNEVAVGTVKYNGNVKIMFTDSSSSTRNQVQSDKKVRQAEHGNRVKIEDPKDYRGLCIFIPHDRNEPVYLARGSEPYKGKISKNIKVAIDQVQNDRKYYDIIFDHPNNLEMQNRALLQMVKKNPNISDVSYNVDKKTSEKIDKVIEKRKE